MNQMKMKIHNSTRLLALVMSMFIAGINAFGAEIAQADSAYTKGNYEEAAEIYSNIIKNEGISAGLLFNLGNTYYKLGKEGEAMICYERAKRIDPDNEQINQNLQFLKAKVLDVNKAELKGKEGNLDPDQDTFIQSVYNMIAVESKSNNWAVFAVIAFILFLGGLALYMFTPNVLARKTGFFSGLVFLGFTVVFLIFSYMAANNFTREDEAIILDFSTQLLEKPQSDAKPSTTPLHKGTKLKILEEKPAGNGNVWLKVKLNSSNSGWIKKDQLEII